MAVRPQSGEDKSDLLRGEGKITPEYEYLKYADPAAYQWNKLKDTGNVYVKDLDEHIWAEAARRGEKEALLNAIQMNTENDANIASKQTVLGEQQNFVSALNDINKLKTYGEYIDYDAFMLAMEKPFMDNTEKVERYDPETGYYFGTFTDREWADQILQADIARIEGTIKEDEKRRGNFFTRLPATIADAGLRLVTGIVELGSDVFNLVQGVVNTQTSLLEMMFTGSPKNLNEAFLSAFTDDDIIQQLANSVEQFSYEFERDYTMFVDASTGEVTTIGKYWRGAIDAIGYLMPAVGVAKALSLGAKGLKTVKNAGKVVDRVVKPAKNLSSFGNKLFYAGITSGNIKQSVEQAMNNGLSLNQLNAGEILLNASVKAAAQYAVEVALGKIMGFSQLDRMIGMGTKELSRGAIEAERVTVKTVEKAGIASMVGTTKGKAAGKALTRLGKDALKEGIEETLQDLSDTLIDGIFAGIGDQLADERAQNFSIETLVDSFTIGAIVSIVMGSAANMKYVAPNQRGIMQTNGKSYRMGIFQSMNFAEAMRQLQVLNDVINDRSTSPEKMQEASMKMSFILSTVGDIMSNIGEERTIKANNLLMQSLNSENVKETLATISNKEYANKLLDTFKQSYGEFAQKEVIELIKKAAEKSADKLKDSGTTQIDDIITVEKKSQDNTIIDKTDELLKATKAKAICSTNGKVITKSDDIIFVNTDYLKEQSNIAILRQLGYEAIEERVMKHLSKTQRNLMLEVYRGATGNNGATIEDCVKALLLDKHFYTKVLLRAGETKELTEESFRLFARLDSVVRTEAMAQKRKSSMADDVMRTLLDKVRANMRAGIINYATQCAFIDVDMKINLDNVSVSVLDDETKQIIRENPNYLLTEESNKDISAVKDIPENELSTSKAFAKLQEKRLDYFNSRPDYIEVADKIVSSESEKGSDAVRRLYNSKNPKDFREAENIRRIISRLLREDENIENKAFILPTPVEAYELEDFATIEVFEKAFNASIEELQKGTYKAENLPEETQADIKARNIDFANYYDRLDYCREYLYMLSNCRLTLGRNYEVLKVLNAHEVYPDKFFEIDENSKEDYKKEQKKNRKINEADYNVGKIIENKLSKQEKIYVRDLLKDDLENNPLGDIEITVDFTPRSDRANAYYEPVTNTIVITNKDISGLAAALLHEMTHAVQYHLYNEMKTHKRDLAGGGSPEIFSILEFKDFARLLKDIEKEQPVLYRYIYMNNDEKVKRILYTLLRGENEAMMTMSSSLIQGGFAYIINKDGNITGIRSDTGHIYKLQPSKQYSAGVKRKEEITKEVLKSEDIPLTEEALKKREKYRGSAETTGAREQRRLAKARARRLTKKRAMQSNLKHFYRKGIVNQLDNDVQDFVEATTKEFDKLPKQIRMRIKGTKAQPELEGSLTKQYLLEYTATADDMNDYTFKMLAKHFFKNNELAELTVKEYRMLRDKYVTTAARIYTIARFNKNDELEGAQEEYDELLEKRSYDDIVKYLDNSKLLEKEYSKAAVDSVMAKYNYDEAYAQLPFFKLYDGTVRSLYKINQYVQDVDRVVLQQGLQTHKIQKEDIVYTPEVILEARELSNELLEDAIVNYYKNKFTDKIVNMSDKQKEEYFESLYSKISPAEKTKLFYEFDREAKLYTNTVGFAEEGESEIDVLVDSTSQDDKPWDKLSDKEKRSYVNMYYSQIAGDWSDLNMYEQMTFINYFSNLYAQNALSRTTQGLSPKTDAYREKLEEKYAQVQIAIASNEPIEKVEIVTITRPKRDRPNVLVKEKIYNVGNRILDRILSKSRYNLMSDLSKQYIKYADGEFTLDSEFLNNYKGSLNELYETLRDDEYVLKSTMTSSSRSRADKDKLVRTIKKQKEQLEEAKRNNNKERIEQLEKYLQTNREKLERLESQISRRTKREQEEKQKLASRIKREQARAEKEKAEKEKQKKRAESAKEKTFKDKADPDIEVKLTGQRYKFDTNQEPNDVIRKILKTTFNKEYMQEVQKVDTNEKVEGLRAKDFYEQNRYLLTASITDIANAAEWFMNTEITKIGDMDAIEWTRVKRHYEIIRAFFLSLVVDYSKNDGIWSDLDANLRNKIEVYYKENTSLGSEFMNIQKERLSRNEPMQYMLAKNIVVDGIEIPDKLHDELQAAMSGAVMTKEKIDKIKEVQQKIVQFIETQRTSKKPFLRRITSFRAMSMLSSPLTWLRNIVSNFSLKQLNKLSDKIGNLLFAKQDWVEGQVKMTGNIKVKMNKNDKPTITGQITPEIQEYINKNLFENGLFDIVVNNLSKFNPMDVPDVAKDMFTGKPTTEGVLGTLIIKNLYNEYYNKGLFKLKTTQKFFDFIMKRMSDTAWVREATIRYFAKLLAEHKYDLKNTVGFTNEIANDFAIAVSLGLRDYMHTDNIFNRIEKALSEKEDIASQLAWFGYKMVMPFAATTWNWLKAAWKFSPFGLARAIINSVHIEKKIRKIEELVEAGKSNQIPEIYQYMNRRDMGSGVIGTMFMMFGVILAALGKIQLEDDDYGIPKLRIANVVIDISSIFGSSSMLYGAALMQSALKGDKFDTVMNNFLGLVVEDLPIMSIVELDMHGNGVFSSGVDTLQNMALSFIPNMSTLFAKAVQEGLPKYQGNAFEKFIQRACAKIPFLNNTPVVKKQVDIYTGKLKATGDNTLDTLLNYNIWRLVPYASLDLASQNEQKTTALGLNKSMLKGDYIINDKEFKVSGSLLTELNSEYGKWNAEDLTKFYKNSMKVKVKTKTGYKELTYNQMTEDERKRAVQTIMSNNAEAVKIKAWTSKGNKYYASQSLYNTLKSRGIKTNVYRGTNGFVEK